MICAIIQARLNSSRLPGKVLFEIEGRPMLSYMLERVTASKRIDQLVVATSIEPSDDPITDFCRQSGISCYRGSLENVLDRYYQAALKAKCDVVVRLTADCPLIDPKVIDTVIDVFQSGQFDFAANTVPPEGSTYPDGMDVEVFSFEALERAWKEAKKPSEQEHVTFYFWKNAQLFSTIRYDLQENLADYRLTVDYPEDFEVISSLLGNLYTKYSNFSMKDIIAFLNTNPGIRIKNSHIASNQGWQPAFERDKCAGSTGAANG